MSRIGKKPVQIKDGVEVNISEDVVHVKGSKGSLSQTVSNDIKVTINKEDKTVTVLPVSDDKKLWGKWGLYRVLIDNMINGVSEGFKKVLEINGIGYKAEMKGSGLLVSAGYSHPILYMPCEGIELGIDGPTKIIITGINKQKVGQVAAEIRNIRPPEPYKGKGIRYENEKIKRKVGKTGA